MDNKETHFEEVPFAPKILEQLVEEYDQNPNYFDEESTIEGIELYYVIKRAINELPEKERNVLTRRLGLDMVEPKDYRQIAEELNCDIRQVEILDKKAQNRLRAMQFIGKVFGAYGPDTGFAYQE